MGGRICLQLFELLPTQTEKIVLFAPDGLHKNAWYRFATKTSLGNRLFNYTMQHPAWLFGAMRLLNKTGLLNKSLDKTVHYYLDDATERNLLYRRWMVMRKFNTSIPRVRQMIEAYKIPVRLLFGKHDKLILSTHAAILQNGLEAYVDIFMIEAGHQLLKEKHAPIIKLLLLE